MHQRTGRNKPFFVSDLMHFLSCLENLQMLSAEPSSGNLPFEQN